jgi:Transcriptional regulators
MVKVDMNIERALQQEKPFERPSERAIVNMIHTHNYLMSKLSHFFDGFDITHKQYNILRILRGAGEAISTAVIRDRMVDRMSDVSRIAERMVRKDLIIKQSCERDKRKVDIEISPRGRLLLDEIEEPLKELQMSLIKIDNEQMDLLNHLLDQIRNDQ